jgi:hypothetical protein
MIAIEIRVNGELKAVCGTEDLEQIMAVVRAEGKLGQNTPTNSAPEYKVECMGSHTKGENEKEVLKWVGANINSGDEITIKFIETNDAHQPIDRQVINNG